MIFSGRHIPWRRVQADVQDAPTREQGAPDAPRVGRFRGRPTTTNRLAVNVTPARISSALQNADQGYPADLFQLLQDVTDRSAQINTCLSTRKRGVSQVGWYLKPGGPTPADRQRAEQVEQWIRQIEDLPTALVHLLSAIENGFAAAEIDWQIVTERGQQIARPRALTYAPAW